MIKNYIIKKTASAMAKANGLVKAETKYTRSNDNIYYDFSLLDEIKFEESYEREAIENDLMEHHAICWYEQPIGIILMWDNYTNFIGKVKTAYRRVFKANGKRMMVIVEVTKIEIEKQKRHSIYDRYYETECVYKADNHHSQCDVDLEVSA